MEDKNNPIKWHTMDEAAAKTITDITKIPGKVFEMPISQAPINLQNMPGAVSLYASGDVNPQILQEGLTIGTEFIIIRTEGEIAKAYNFVMAKSSDDKIYFSGPYKKFPDHYFDPKSQIEIEKLFGHTPLAKRTE